MSTEGRQDHSLVMKIREKAPDARQVGKFLAVIAAGLGLLLLTGTTLTGTVVSVVFASPVLIFFSPILVPVGTVLILAVAGFIAAGGFGVAALSVLSWIVNYMRGKNPPGSDQVDYAKQRIVNKARDVTDRAKEYGQYLQNRAHEATNQGS